MGRRLLSWWISCGGLLLALAALGAIAAPPTRAQNQQYVGLVIDFNDGSALYRGCIPYTSGMKGLAVLQSSPYSSSLELDPGFNNPGAGVCSIDQQGCDVSSTGACLCSVSGDTYTYWAYYHLASGAWQHSSQSAGSYVVQPGSVEGWAWGAGKAAANGTPATGTPPPLVSFADLCAAVLTPTATSSPPTASVTGTPPTATPTPTSTRTPLPANSGSNPYEGAAPSPTPPPRPVAATSAPQTAVPTNAPSATATPQTAASPVPTATQPAATTQQAPAATATQAAPTATLAATRASIEPTATATEVVALPSATPAASPSAVPVPTAAPAPGSPGRPALDSSASPSALLATSPPTPPTRTATPGASATRPPAGMAAPPKPGDTEQPAGFDPLPYLAVALILGGLGKIGYDAWRRRQE